MQGLTTEPIEPDGLFDGLHWPSILRWAVLDVVITVVASVPLMFFLAGDGALSDDEEIAGPALEAAASSADFLLWGLALGLSITVYTSFRAARAAGTFHLRHGGWTAVVSALIGLLFLLVPDAGSNSSSSLWYDAVSLGLVLPAGVLGGWLASAKPEPYA